jgi:hypothetical protein
MTKNELKIKVKDLVKQLKKQYTHKINQCGDEMTIVIKNGKDLYSFEYGQIMSVNTEKLKEVWDICYVNNMVWYNVKIDDYSVAELRLLTKSMENMLNGEEVKDGIVLQKYKDANTKPMEISYYQATMRIEAAIDFQIALGYFAKINKHLTDNDKYAFFFIDKYETHKMKSVMYDDTCTVSIHKDFDINDVKAIMCNISDLDDAHIMIQSLDYAQFKGVRDRNSHYPEYDLIEKWGKRLKDIIK